MEQELEQELEIKDNELEFSRCLIMLMKGVVEQESQPQLWNQILANQARIAEYVEKISLRLYIDKGIGYAYLRQQENENLPKLVNRHQLSYGLSMLLVILRKSLGDYDAASGDSFYIIKKSDIQLKMKGFFPAITNETKYIQEIDRHIKRAVEMGFLKPVKGKLAERAANSDGEENASSSNDEAFVVKEIIRSFITASWLKNFEERLNEYISFNDEDEETAENEENVDDKDKEVSVDAEIEDKADSLF